VSIDCHELVRLPSLLIDNLRDFGYIVRKVNGMHCRPKGMPSGQTGRASLGRAHSQERCQRYNKKDIMIEILGYLFLVIFGLTALLTLLSLPNWIVIPDVYRKTLFRALILEVVGAIIIVFTNHFINDSGEGTKHIIKTENWIALSLDSAQIIQPRIEIVSPDTTYEFFVGEEPTAIEARLSANKFFGTLSEAGLQVKNFDSIVLGVIPTSSLTDAGLFNSIKSNEGEISSLSNYSLVKFRRDSLGKWEMEGKFLKGSPFTFEVYDDRSKTIYQIVNSERGDTIFTSNSVAKQLFNLDSRIIHFFEHEGQFYLFRIAGADLSKGSELFVNVLQIRFEPTIKK